jgi:flagellin
MALAIATNNGALQAAAAASSVNRSMETSMERLSTGMRINSASDDAAGVAISSRLSAEIRGTNQSIRNALDGQSLIDTAEGAHKEVENLLQRMRELAIQAANGTNDADDITNLEAEFTALSTEITRIGEVTSFAGKALTGTDATAFSFQVGSGTATANQISVTINSIKLECPHSVVHDKC